MEKSSKTLNSFYRCLLPFGEDDDIENIRKSNSSCVMKQKVKQSKSHKDLFNQS